MSINQQDFRFPSFPHRRESSNPLKKLDTRIRGYDEFKGLAKVLTNYVCWYETTNLYRNIYPQLSHLKKKSRFNSCCKSRVDSRMVGHSKRWLCSCHI